MTKEASQLILEKSRQVRGFSLVVLLIILLGACTGEKSDLVTLTGEAQGTTFTIKYRDAEQRDLSNEVAATLREMDRSLSLWVDGSTVNAFNAAIDTFSSDDTHFRIIVARSQQLWRDTDGAFDPTVLPLVKAWGLGKEGKSALDTTAVDSILQFTGLDRIAVDERWRNVAIDPPMVTYRKFDPRVQFDPNGIAQGYTVDVIAFLLEAKGIADYMVEVGGELRTRGTNDKGEVWTIQIDKPVEGDAHVRQTVLSLRDRSLATSGNYRKFIAVEGRRFGHTIDPRSGRPAMNALLSATIIASDCATADALATAMLVLGPEEAQAWLLREGSVDAYLISDDGQGGFEVWTTPGWPGALDR